MAKASHHQRRRLPYLERLQVRGGVEVYELVSRIQNFYRQGDDKLTFGKILGKRG